MVIRGEEVVQILTDCVLSHRQNIDVGNLLLGGGGQGFEGSSQDIEIILLLFICGERGSGHIAGLYLSLVLHRWGNWAIILHLMNLLSNSEQSSLLSCSLDV